MNLREKQDKIFFLKRELKKLQIEVDSENKELSDTIQLNWIYHNTELTSIVIPVSIIDEYVWIKSMDKNNLCREIPYTLSNFHNNFKLLDANSEDNFLLICKIFSELKSDVKKELNYYDNKIEEIKLFYKLYT